MEFYIGENVQWLDLQVYEVCKGVVISFDEVTVCVLRDDNQIVFLHIRDTKWD